MNPSIKEAIQNIHEMLQKRWDETFNTKNDTVRHPSHYNTGGIETLDYIKAKVADYPSYAVGNIIKYVSRFEHKNGLEDLKKAQFYLNDLIEWSEEHGAK